MYLNTFAKIYFTTLRIPHTRFGLRVAAKRMYRGGVVVGGVAPRSVVPLRVAASDVQRVVRCRVAVVITAGWLARFALDDRSPSPPGNP